jgi:hypothetical protein
MKSLIIKELNTQGINFLPNDTVKFRDYISGWTKITHQNGLALTVTIYVGTNLFYTYIAAEKKEVKHIIEPIDCKSEKNDCTVRTTKNAFGITYDEAYQKLKEFGRKKNHGCVYSSFIHTLGGEFAGKKIFRLSISRMTIKTFCSKYNKGTFILGIRGHVLTVIDGIIYDRFKNKLTKIVVNAWRIGEYVAPVIKTTVGKATQKSQVIYWAAKGLNVDQVVEKTGIVKANVRWYFSKLKLAS